ncbi:kinesin light chain [Colletotrichum truncatum]|uniref:Kinesin light chain n=1 Tax=Colletotrichum truncatum TaxID=5467 RepID=A0ACC3YC74_COLTU|nr:kinesin light chain [Colletotrichum truncatum]KAF6793873.1 kinesin light chain [Colletotrichum truncatum]
MSSRTQVHRREDFRIAIICALPLEYDAVSFAFDEIWDDRNQLGKAMGDCNNYTVGRIGSHHAVLLLLPTMGKVSASGAAATLRLSYTEINLVILAGICGGVPGVGTDTELLLGDAIISIVQYDLGRKYPDRFLTKVTVEDSLGRPNKEIRSFVATFQTHHIRSRLQDQATQILEQIQQKVTDVGLSNQYKRPAAIEDRLFKPDYVHRHHDFDGCGCSESGACEEALATSCDVLQCDLANLVSR